jgi:hypothetical protein
MSLFKSNNNNSRNELTNYQTKQVQSELYWFLEIGKYYDKRNSNADSNDNADSNNNNHNNNNNK